MTSFIAAGGSGRSASFIPAVPAALSVTTIAFMIIFTSVICLFGGNVAALESPFDISCQRPWVAVMAVRIFLGFLLLPYGRWPSAGLEKAPRTRMNSVLRRHDEAPEPE